MRLKRIITAFATLATAMAGFAALSGISSAAATDETEWYLYIEGHEIDATLDNSGNGWSWDSQAMTLTLEGYDSTAIYFDNYDEFTATEYTCPIFNIEVKGINSISNTDDNQPVYGGVVTDALSAQNAMMNIYGTDKETDKLIITNSHFDEGAAIIASSSDSDGNSIDEICSVEISNVAIDINDSEYGIRTANLQINNADIAISEAAISIWAKCFDTENTSYTMDTSFWNGLTALIYCDSYFDAVNCSFDMDIAASEGNDELFAFGYIAGIWAYEINYDSCTCDIDYNNNIKTDDIDSSDAEILFCALDSYSSAYSNSEFDITANCTENADLEQLYCLFGSSGTATVRNSTINAEINNSTLARLLCVEENMLIISDNTEICYNVGGNNKEVYGISPLNSNNIEMYGSSYEMNVTGTFEKACAIEGTGTNVIEDCVFDFNFGEDATVENGTACAFDMLTGEICNSAINFTYNAKNSSVNNIISSNDIILSNIEYNIYISGAEHVTAVNASNSVSITDSTIKTDNDAIEYLIYDGGTSTEIGEIKYSDIDCRYTGSLINYALGFEIKESVINAGSDTVTSFVAISQGSLTITDSVVDIASSGFGIDVPNVTFDDSRINIKSAYIYNTETITLNYDQNHLWVAETENGILGTLDNVNVEIPTSGKLIYIQPTVHIQILRLFATDDLGDYDIETSFFADDTAQIPNASMSLHIKSYSETSNNWVHLGLRWGNKLFPIYDVDTSLDENGTVSPYNAYFTEYNAGNPTTDYSIGYAVEDITEFEDYVLYLVAKYYLENFNATALLDIITMGTVCDASGAAREIGTLDMCIALRGDANLDNVIDTRDAALMAKYASELAIGTENPVISAINDALAKIVANVNNDDVIDTRDAANVALYSSKNANYVSGVPVYQKYVDIWTEMGCIE